MIRVCVYLLSAISADRNTELARMDIFNDGEQSLENSRLGTYVATTFRGRSTDALNRAVMSKRVGIANWPRADLHVWNLVRFALERMGYTQSRSAAAGEVVRVVAGYRRPLRMPASVGDRWTYTDDPSREQGPVAEWEPLYTLEEMP